MTSLAIQTHIVLIIALFAIIARNAYLLLVEKDFVTLAKKIKFVTPMFHMFNASVIFSGIIIQFFYQNFSNIVIYIMILSSIFIMVTEIKRYKKMRIIKSTDYKLQEEFRIFAKKVYFIDMFLIIFIYILGEMTL